MSNFITKNDELILEDLVANGSFCAMPFVSMMVNTNQKLQYCCIASASSEPQLADENTKKSFIVTENQINDVWKSSAIKTVRNAMLSGEKVKACDGCYSQEVVGKSSSRKMMTTEWVNKIGKELFLDNIKKYIANNDAELPIFYLDLRLSNMCNLKCRMCNPFNSSQIAKEHFEIWNDEDYQQVWSQQYGRNPTWLKNEATWQDSNILWDELVGLIPNLKKVYMTGGEPTLIKNNYRFMKESISSGMNDSMELFFNLNCTNVTDEFLGLIAQFKYVSINASIDGVGKVNDYIRYPSKWDKISTNFEKIAQLPNVNLNITPVVQVHNVLDLENILNYAEEVSSRYKKDIGLDFLFNWSPKWYDVTILPEYIRKISSNQLKQYRNNSPRYSNNWLIKNSVDSTINLLESSRNLEYSDLLDKFIKITRVYDKQRSQSFETTFPEIYKAIND